MFRAPTTPIGTYRARFGALPGFFVDEAIACWDYLLSTQAAMKVGGNVLEIGVYRGKSALLAACHMAAPEVLLLNDIAPIDDVVEAVRSLRGPEVRTVVAKSFSLRTQAALAPLHGTMRWIHIDGDHSGFSVAADLLTAELFLGDKGIICVDDFFSTRYPQVTAAVFRFLEQRNPIYRMVLCGAGKAYLCRSEDHALYDSLVSKYLGPHLRQAKVSASLHKSTPSNDGGCFGLGARQDDRDYVGIDSNPDVIPG